MAEIIWTVILTITGVTGIYLIPRRPVDGWTMYLLNELGWLVYGVTIASPPILVMSIIWGAMGVRNLRLERSRAVH